MGGRYKLVFWGALLVAAAATFGAYKLLAANNSGSVAMRPVVVASSDIPEGSTIDRIALKSVEWPVQNAPVGAYSSIDSVAGRVTRIAVFAGEAIVPGRLAPVGTGPGLELKIPPGQRAMAVRINDVAGISGLLQPNSRVDVLVTIREGTSERQVAKLFMSNMLVLSVGTEVQRDSQGKPINATTVTLAVTPEEAERLAIAMNTGAIQLVLRGYGDPDSVRTKGATSGDVLSSLKGTSIVVPPLPPQTKPRVIYRPLPKPAPAPAPITRPPPPPPPDSAVVNVYRAGKSEKQKFDTTGKR
ncbi:MAG TPA: Flp pilus assembly protein CpaB [Gemmatimonadaceae bacterium]|nr:Flp pilus assembly protein CpaB [Gemmatimonadaceae bacterium]